MLNRSESVLNNQSLFALKQSNLMSYCEKIPSYGKLLSEAKSIALDKLFAQLPEKSCSERYQQYDIHQFIKEYSLLASNLSLPAPQLLMQKMSSRPSLLADIAKEAVYPPFFSPLSRKIQCYIALIMDVLNNKLAQNSYERDEDQENVTEREHALQAAKISFQVGMPLEDIIALLLHDIARPSINDAMHGHQNHCREGSSILKPLGLSLDYSGLHAFAKYLLFSLCPPYTSLISKTSIHTLKIQQDSPWPFEALEAVHKHDLVEKLYRLMLMRLIDDMSKVPMSELNEGFLKEFNAPFIQQMLEKQLIAHLTTMDNTSEVNDTLDKQLDEAIQLLSRAHAKGYSNNPGLYETYADIIRPLLPQLSGNSSPENQVQLKF